MLFADFLISRKKHAFACLLLNICFLDIYKIYGEIFFEAWICRMVMYLK